MTIEITLQPAHSEASFRRAHAYASKESAAIDVSVHREHDGWAVYWNVNRGRGWGRGWRKTCLTQQAAGELGAAKWAACLAWLEKTEPLQPSLPGDWTC